MAVVWPEAHVDMGDYRLDFEANTPLGPQLEEKAREELRETSELRESAIEQLRKMVKGKQSQHILYLQLHSLSTN